MKLHLHIVCLTEISLSFLRVIFLLFFSEIYSHTDISLALVLKKKRCRFKKKSAARSWWALSVPWWSAGLYKAHSAKPIRLAARPLPLAPPPRNRPPRLLPSRPAVSFSLAPNSSCCGDDARARRFPAPIGGSGAPRSGASFRSRRGLERLAEAAVVGPLRSRGPCSHEGRREPGPQRRR